MELKGGGVAVLDLMVTAGWTVHFVNGTTFDFQGAQIFTDDMQVPEKRALSKQSMMALLKMLP